MTESTGARRGRPKGSRNKKTIVQEFARRRHAISDSGRQISVTTAELLIRLILKKVMAGDVRADKLLGRLQDRFAPDTKTRDYALFPEPLTTEEWIALAEARNTYARSPEADSALN